MIVFVEFVHGKWICSDGKECGYVSREFPAAYDRGMPACWYVHYSGRLVCCSRLTAGEIEDACKCMVREILAGRSGLG